MSKKGAPLGARTDHLPELDGIRGLAALYVVVHHAWLEVVKVADLASMAALPRKIAFLCEILFGYGRYAVDVFIVLSGFCLMLPVVQSAGALRGGAMGFYWRRTRRILPPFYLAMALSLLFIAVVGGVKRGTHWDESLPVTPAAIVGNLLQLQDVIDRGRINHVFWSIAVEWKIYLLFPLLLIFWRRLGAAATLLLTIAVAFPLSWMLSESPLHGLTVHYLAMFAMGMAAAALAVRGVRPGLLRWAGLGLFTATLAATFLLHFRGTPLFTYWIYVDGFIGAGAALFLAGLVGGRCFAASLLRWRPLAWLGLFAYSLYLLHAPLLNAWWLAVTRHVGGSVLTGFAVMCAGVPLIVACAYLFYLGCERPFISRRRKTPPPAEPPADAGVAPPRSLRDYRRATSLAVSESR
jgi:peptidoglycan/LPS O-acetylase OafA/YrhL